MAGIYIHIPFCKQRCSYCDFHFSTQFSGYHQKMIRTICLELRSRKKELGNIPIQSIYFGGGTPSLLLASDFEEIMRAILENYVVNSDLECTLEANPDDIDVENLRLWKRVGINRLSIGIQSFREQDLKWMNRAHTVEESEQCIALAKAEGFQAFSVDLIYGLPNLSLQEWGIHIQNVIDYNVNHVSAYCLTVEMKTALAKQVKQGTIVPATEDEQADQFEFLVEKLKAAGYEQYEVSNFCRPGKEAVHNSGYWRGSSYLGVGPSAHSYNGKSRRFNIANNLQYMKLFQAKKTYFETEDLSKHQKFNELILTGLRTKWGVSKQALTAILPFSPAFLEQKNDFLAKSWLDEDDDTLRLIGAGWLMADYIASALFAEE